MAPSLGQAMSLRSMDTIIKTGLDTIPARLSGFVYSDKTYLEIQLLIFCNDTSYPFFTGLLRCHSLPHQLDDQEATYCFDKDGSTERTAL